MIGVSPRTSLHIVQRARADAALVDALVRYLLIECMFLVVLQKSMPAQIWQLILKIKDKLKDLCRNSLLQNDCLTSFCELNIAQRARADAALVDALVRVCVRERERVEKERKREQREREVNISKE